VADHLGKLLASRASVKEYLDGVEVAAGEVVLLKTSASTRARRRTVTICQEVAALCDVFVMMPSYGPSR